MSDGELRLEYETGHVLQGLIAHDAQILEVIDRRLGVSHVTRDAWIKFSGSDEALAKVRRLFEDLEEAHRGQEHLTKRDVLMALDLASAGSGDSLRELKKMSLVVGRGAKTVSPRTPQQLAYLKGIFDHDVTLGLGPAGTGKTYLAMAAALSMLKSKEIHRVVLTRPAVEAGEALGFLPGDLRDKVAPYLRPMYDAIFDMLDPATSQKYLDDGTIEIAPLAYMRGRTLARSFVILDEAQNTTCEQMLMFLTRIGEDSRCVITGDPSQIDLKNHVPSGLLEAMDALRRTKGVGMVRLTTKDVVRHPVVARIIDSYERHRGQAKERTH